VKEEGEEEAQPNRPTFSQLKSNSTKLQLPRTLQNTTEPYMKTLQKVALTKNKYGKENP